MPDVVRLLVDPFMFPFMQRALVATLIVYLWERGGTGPRVIAVLTFIVGGALVEFWWPALLCCLTASGFIRRPSPVRKPVGRPAS